MKRQRRQPPAQVVAALGELKAALSGLYGARLRGVYLYGSYARGDYRPDDSDVDVLVVLAGEVQPSEEVKHYSQIVSDICLRHDLLIATFPVSERWFHERHTPFFENVRREAVPA